jgi:hypothetical protein
MSPFHRWRLKGPASPNNRLSTKPGLGTLAQHLLSFPGCPSPLSASTAAPANSCGVCVGVSHGSGLESCLIDELLPATIAHSQAGPASAFLHPDFPGNKQDRRRRGPFVLLGKGRVWDTWGAPACGSPGMPPPTTHQKLLHHVTKAPAALPLNFPLL